MSKKKTQPKQKSKSARARPRQRATPTIPAWLNAVRNPWKHGPTSIPDEMCQPSLKYESRYSNAFPASDIATVPTTQHGLLIGVGPYLTPTSIAHAGAIAYRGWNSDNVSYDGNLNLFEMPNTAAMFPAITQGASSSTTGYSYRVTAMSAKLSYAGTEFNRSGRIVAGLASPDESAAPILASSRGLNPLSMVFGGTGTAPPTQVIQSVRNRLRRVTTVRNPDGSVEVTWLPTGVPRYTSTLQSAAGAVNEHAENLGPVIIFAVTGDTAGATQIGNNYSIDVVMHIEAIPLSRYALAIGPTPSPYDTAALARCLNSFEQMSSVSEWDASGHHALDDGGQANSGSAWEFISNVGTSIYTGAQATLDGFGAVARNPVGRAALQYGYNRARSRRPPMAPALMY